MYWKRINKLKQPEQSAMYSMGIVLQNFEENVLRMLFLFEKKERKNLIN